MSAKKKPAGRRSAPVELDAPSSTQPTKARRAAEAELRSLIAKFAAPHVRLVAAVRRSLRKRLPAAHEVVYEYRDFVVISFSPSGRGHEGVLAIHASASGLKLYFNAGKDLPDPEKLLQGSAKLVRWIDLASAATLSHAAVASLIDEAIARNPVPFASAGSGGGSVAIRPTAAGKRRGAA